MDPEVQYAGFYKRDHDYEEHHYQVTLNDPYGEIVFGHRFSEQDLIELKNKINAALEERVKRNG
jgi:hypothetical protein